MVDGENISQCYVYICPRLSCIALWALENRQQCLKSLNKNFLTYTVEKMFPFTENFNFVEIVKSFYGLT